VSSAGDPPPERNPSSLPPPIQQENHSTDGVFTQPGSKTEVAALRRDVCFAPKSGHWTDIPGGPLSANNGSSRSVQSTSWASSATTSLPIIAQHRTLQMDVMPTNVVYLGQKWADGID